MILDETNEKDVIFLILHFLREEGYDGSSHSLEQDSRVFFDFSYFSNAISNGNGKEAEEYLSAFTTPDANTYSSKMFIDLFNCNFSDKVSEQTCCVDKELVRAKLCVHLRELADNNPCLRGKLVLPELKESALLSLIFLICPKHPKMDDLKEDLIFLILQFLYEAKFNSTLHKLEQETKVFFNVNYLVELMTLNQLDKAEEYVAAFTNQAENKYSKAMFLEMQKLKCIKWEVTTPSGSPGNMSPTTKLHASVAILAQKNPVLKDKLKLPSMEKSRLLTLMKQAMEWWKLHLCINSKSLENVPVVPNLCGAPSSRKSKLSPRRKLDYCKPKEINGPSECSSMVLPDNCLGGKIARLTYTSSGDFILALSEDSTHKLWMWPSSQNEFCKGTPPISKENVFWKPRLHDPQSGETMVNETPFFSPTNVTNLKATSVQNSTSCFAIKGSYLFSTWGGKIAVFDLKSFEEVADLGRPTATYFVFIPGDLLAVGQDDGSIFIHCLSTRKIKAKLEGHSCRIVCLAFSRCFNVLVSCGADGKLCVWNAKSWVQLTIKNPVHTTYNRHNHESSSLVTHIQFDPYQIELLVVQEGWMGVYNAPNLDSLVEWVPAESDGLITCATYSSDGEILYVGFRSGSINILDSQTFVTICRINLTTFAQPSPCNSRLYPAVIAAHPSHRSQISVGLSNCKVIVIQPLVRGGWGEEVSPEDSGDNHDKV